MDNSLIEGIIFDLDNTLVLSEKVYFEAIKNVASDIFVEMDWEFYNNNYVGHPLDVIYESILSFAEVEPTKEKTDRLIEETALELKDILSKKKVEVVPGAAEFLEEVKKSGIPITIASNSNKNFAEMLLFSAGIIDYFKRIVTVEQVKNPKPDTEIFISAAHLLAADIKRCVIFEDSYQGLMGAKDSNAYVVAVTTSVSAGAGELIGVDKIIPDYKAIDLKTLVSDFNNWVKKGKK